MAKPIKAKFPSLEELFELSDGYLSPPDIVGLRSALIEAADIQNGEQVVLKYWMKSGETVDADIRELWRHDMRQSERVRAYPDADDVIVQMMRYGETRDAFYLVFPPDLAPIDYTAKNARSDHWLKNLGSVRSRVVFWKNARRLIKALGAIHAQGLVHGRLDRTSVFTGGSASGTDFRLSGFEFCLRVFDPEKAPIAALARSKGAGQGAFSFVDDWRALAAVLCSLLGIETLEGGNADEESRPSELDLLRLLYAPERNRALDVYRILPLVDEIIDELEAESLVDNGRFVLALRLGPTSKLSECLFRASNEAFDVDDAESQIRFVRAQLEVGADLVKNSRGELVLATDTVVYELRPMTPLGQAETWNVAVTNSASMRTAYHFGRHSSVRMLSHRIEIVRFGAAANRLRELRGDALAWDDVLRAIEPEQDSGLQIRRGLLLAQIADALYQASEVTPVEILERGKGRQREIELIAREIQ